MRILYYIVTKIDRKCVFKCWQNVLVVELVALSKSQTNPGHYDYVLSLVLENVYLVP